MNPRHTSSATRPRADGRVNILIVDDLREKHLVFRSILEELGENIVSAYSGREALAQVLSSEFAVILLDVNMPDIDGLETASWIRQYKRSAQTPIVFITSYVDELQAQRGYALGAVDYIPSPVVPEVLRSKVRVFVELYRMHRQLQLRAVEREDLARSEAARAAAEAASRRADYLAGTTQQLSRSLDLDQTVAAMLDVCVPTLGEQAMLLSVGTDGRIVCTASNPPGVFKEPLLPPLQETVQDAVARQQFESWPVPEGRLGSLVGPSHLIFPLREIDRARSALVLFARQGYDAARVALATEVASRAGIALENARLYREVQQADRRKNEFLAMLAHELRNPLAPIRNAVHIMQDGAVALQTLHWARDVISRQSEHMARLIDDLLDVSRIVQGKVTVRPERLALASLIERSIEASAPRVEARGQRLQVDLPDVPVVLQGDPVRLAQVVSNLLNNASKFSPERSTIQLQARFEDQEVCVSVRDQGCGITADFLPHIFELFIQGDQTLDRAQGGLGIGLTLVKHLIEQHGGRVDAHSDGPGTGTLVRVFLPAQVVQEDEPSSAPPEAGTPRKATAPGGRHRVLVVDDLAASVDTLTMLLEMEGYEVRVATDGLQALKAAEDFVPDVVLLDIGLPGMNGFEVAQRLRAMPACSEALLVALTGYGEPESRMRSTQAGFDHHVVKPADIQQLLTLIAESTPQRS